MLSQGNSWCISVPPQPVTLSILCSVKRARFRAGNFTCVFSSLVCFGTAILTPLYHEGSFADRCLWTTFSQFWESEGAANLDTMSKKLTRPIKLMKGKTRDTEGKRGSFSLACSVAHKRVSAEVNQEKVYSPQTVNQTGQLCDETGWTGFSSRLQV